MRLNAKELLHIMEAQNLTKSDICIRTGLYSGSLEWILNNGQVSGEALERIAESVGVKVEDIVLPDPSANIENVIEFIKDRDKATVTFSQGRYKSRVKKLSVSHPGECEIVAENKDGSLCAHIPVSWIRINPSMSLTEEQRQNRAELMYQNIFHSGYNRHENG